MQLYGVPSEKREWQLYQVENGRSEHLIVAWIIRLLQEGRKGEKECRDGRGF